MGSTARLFGPAPGPMSHGIARLSDPSSGPRHDVVGSAEVYRPSSGQTLLAALVDGTLHRFSRTTPNKTEPASFSNQHTLSPRNSTSPRLNRCPGCPREW